MKIFSFLAMLATPFLAFGQTVNWMPYERPGDCAGNGTGIIYDLWDPDGIILNPATAYIVSYYGAGDSLGLPIDTFGLVTGEFHDSIPLPSINISTHNVDSSHRATVYYQYFEWMIMAAVDWQQSIFVDSLTMECDIVEVCHGDSVQTNGGVGVWFQNMAPLGVGTSVDISDTGTVVLVPELLYTGRYDNWTPIMQFVDPTWASAAVMHTCDNQHTGAIMVLPDGTSPYVYSLNGVNSNFPVFPGLDAGTYVVSVSDSDGCNIEFEEIVLDTCDVITSISENVVTENPKLYPNPASDIVYVIVESFSSYELHDYAGRIVASGTLAEGKNVLEVSTLAAGAYRVLLRSSDGRTSPATFVVAR